MRLAVGLMSGTSLDGIDAILIEIEGYGRDTHFKVIDFECYKLEQSLKDKIKANMNLETSNVKTICSLNFELGHVFAQAVLSLCHKNKVKTSDLDFVASHGQTLYHLPKKEIEISKWEASKGNEEFSGSQQFSGDEETYFASTLQLGEPSVIAHLCKTKVISNFRTMDMAAGGEGAPLVPYVDALLFGDPQKTIGVHNIGGIANTTILKKGEIVLAYDTGPGNMIIDALCEHYYGANCDLDGKYAAKGKINNPLLAQWLEMPFFKIKGPKSTGRELFGKAFVNDIIGQAEAMQIEPNDLIATATAFTAHTMALAYLNLPFMVDEIIICGGGAYNKTLLQYLMKVLPMIKITTLEAHGYSSFAKEALAFAILGNERLHNQCANVRCATGANENVVLGSITMGR